MSKLLAQKLLQVKQEIKNRYLAGESVPSIAKSYEVGERDIYYHLGKLTAQDKGIHAMNASLKMTKRKDDANK